MAYLWHIYDNTKSAIIHLSNTPYLYSYIIYILLLLLFMSYCHTLIPPQIEVWGVEKYLGVKGIYAKNAINRFCHIFIGK